LRHGLVIRPVEPQVFDLLEYLIQNRERVVSRDDLLKAIGRGRIVSDGVLSVRINAARHAIGDNGREQRLIRTFPRKGFALSARSTTTKRMQ
jgi:DNA-binding winged helix-turn-helix (wHTH) protein